MITHNTLCHVGQDPSGPPQLYGDALRTISALDLATELAMLEDQHAIYLHAVPRVTEADSAMVTAMLPDEFWTRGFGINSKTSLADRVGKYVGGCAGFGVTEEELKPMVEEAKRVTKS